MSGWRVAFSPIGATLVALSCIVLTAGRAAALSPTEVENRVEELVTAMSLEEKLDMLSGTGFDSKPVPRLGIPAMRMTDGPSGVVGPKSTAFPAGIARALLAELIAQPGSSPDHIFQNGFEFYRVQHGFL